MKPRALAREHILLPQHLKFSRRHPNKQKNDSTVVLCLGIPLSIVAFQFVLLFYRYFNEKT